MAKIMLVEDDNNLREIYEARLLAEGYEIVSAHDGEEALALAVKEKPDLIISDVMMPKISGFDMLDILRSTPETKDTKVIMMTALSQAEDKSRADKLGADRYLVKSQVTLEDVAKIAKEVLEGTTTGGSSPVTATATTDTPVADPAATPPADAPAPTVVAPEPVATAPAPEPVVAAPVVEPAAPAPAPEPVAAPVAPAVDPVTPAPEPPPAAPAMPVADPSASVAAAPTAASEQAAVTAQVDSFVASQPAVTSTAPIDDAAAAVASTSPEAADKKVIEPINDLSVTPDLNKLAEEEDKKAAAAAGTPPPPPGEDPNLIAL